ncbi:PP0621 family protein [Achromobacter mucicolens]|uniref:PP0621 family protein n=1 Tax=Achromobacter mucicolens TaxID=1389922 RepID=UPI002452A897|nr:PP0621 family protein [Achromobacter mucicolens]WGJ90116.1 PP0621 family protein [Achromobacter mucicolens]
MGKLLFWIVLIILVLFVARVAGRMAAQRQAGPKKKAQADAAPPVLESMVRCAHCGIHLPRSEALLQNGQTWCSADHARLGPAKR